MAEAASVLHLVHIWHRGFHIHGCLSHDEMKKLESENAQEVQSVDCRDFVCGHHNCLVDLLKGHQVTEKG